MPETLRRLLEVGVLCNEADLEIGRQGLRIRGSSTEGALLLAARNAGIDTDALRETFSLIDIRHRETGTCQVGQVSSLGADAVEGSTAQLAKWDEIAAA